MTLATERYIYRDKYLYKHIPCILHNFFLSVAHPLMVPITTRVNVIRPRYLINLNGRILHMKLRWFGSKK